MNVVLVHGSCPVRPAARDRFGVDAIEIDGRHSPMLTRTDELAGPLDELARDRLTRVVPTRRDRTA